ncbi:hypothetical protein [Oceanobacillus kimchii]
MDKRIIEVLRDDLFNLGIPYYQTEGKTLRELKYLTVKADKPWSSWF